MIPNETACQVKSLHQQLELIGYQPGDTVHYRAFLPHKKGEKSTDKGRKVSAEYPGIPPQLTQWQAEGRGIYFVVNKGGAGIEEITECTALFYEHDNLPKDVSALLWEDLGLPEPTFQIDTGGKSIHSYWVFDSPVNSTLWRSLQTDLLDFADADRSLKNQNRVMRAAGFAHAETGKLAEIIPGSGKRYEYKTLRQIIPGSSLAEVTTQKVQQPVSSPRSYDDERSYARELLRYIPTRQPGTGSYEESFKVLAALCHKFGNDEGLRMARDWSPDEDWGEDLGRKVNGLRGGANPVTFGSLVAIAKQHGFKPPIQSESWSPSPKTLQQTQESVVSQDNGYASFRLAVAGALALEDPVEREFELQNVKDKFRKPMALVRRIVQEISRVESTIKREFTIQDLEGIKSIGVPYLIPRFIPQQGLVMLGGEAKGGKSKLTYEMVGALLGNRPFMGYQPKPNTRILMIQAEENEITMANNLEGVGVLFNDAIDKSRLLIKKDWDIDDTSTLERWIAEFKPDLVVIDSFKATNQSTGVSENSPEAANPVYALQKLLHGLGIAGLIIHHTNKNKDAQGVQKLGGTGGLPAASDNIILLSRLSENPSDSKRLLSLYGRELNGRFQVELDDSEFPKYSWNLIQEIGHDAESTNLQGRVLAALKLNEGRTEGVTSSWLKESLSLPADNKSIYKALNALVQSSMVNCERSPRDKRVRLYSLPGYQSAETQAQQGIEKVSKQVSTHVPVVSQDNFWGEGKAKGADPIAFDGSVAQYRMNAAPALPKRNASLLPNPNLVSSHEEKVSSQGVDTNVDTFSNPSTARDTDRKYPSSLPTHAHAQPQDPSPFNEGDVVTVSYPGSDSTDIQTAINAGQPAKGTVGVLTAVNPRYNPILEEWGWTAEITPIDEGQAYPVSIFDLEIYEG
jgi:hypothetical protein